MACTSGPRSPAEDSQPASAFRGGNAFLLASRRWRVGSKSLHERRGLRASQPLVPMRPGASLFSPAGRGGAVWASTGLGRGPDGTLDTLDLQQLGAAPCHRGFRLGSCAHKALLRILLSSSDSVAQTCAQGAAQDMVYGLSAGPASPGLAKPQSLRAMTSPQWVVGQAPGEEGRTGLCTQGAQTEDH